MTNHNQNHHQLVVAERVSREFQRDAIQGPLHAVRDVTCAIAQGDRIALMGPSGSGKSSLLHLLGGLDQPSSGTVSWPALGDRSNLRPTRVVDIFQGPSLLTPLNVLDNVRLPMLMAGIESNEARDDARLALEAFQVGHLAEKLPEEISGGQAQRVSIARAIAVRPSLILADEPTGQLDSRTSADVLDALLRIADEMNAAIVVSTHDPGVAARLTTLWLMRDGVLDTSARASAPRPQQSRSRLTVVDPSSAMASGATGAIGLTDMMD